MGKLSRRIKKTLDFHNESFILIIELIIRERNMTETIFIDAVEGGKVAVFKGVGNEIGRAKTAKMLAYILDTHKIFGEVMFCSSMDFATEVGFADDGDARKLFDDAVEMRDICLSSAHHQSKLFDDAVEMKG